MTAKDPSPMSEEELNARLQSLLLRAHVNGIEVEGGWDCTNEPEYPNWDVVVTEVRTDEDPDSTSSA